MRLKTLLILFSITVLPNKKTAHEFYISHTSIKYNSENQELFIRIKLFVNDLEESLSQNQNATLGLWKNLSIENSEPYIEQYLQSKLSVSINDKPVEIQFIEKKMETGQFIEDNIITCELEACNIIEITKISIQNNLLTESFDSQVNIVEINANGIRSTLNLDKKLPEGEVIY